MNTSRVRLLCLRVACVASILVQGSCRSPADTEQFVSFANLSLAPIHKQQATERIWRDVGIRKLFDLPTTDADTLWSPGGVRVDHSGSVYIVDFGDLKVKRFSPDGEHVGSYGNGRGEGPGELISILDLSVTVDSVLSIVDNAARQILFFDIRSEVFLKERDVLDGSPVRHQMTASGREYLMLSNNVNLFESRKGSDVVTFGSLVEDTRNFGLVSGFITTYEESMIYVPTYYPVIARYNADGILVYARTTLDLGRLDEPEMVEMSLGGAQAFRVSGQRLNGEVSVYHDQLFVHVTEVPGVGDVIDVYRADTGDYEHSFQLPEQHYAYVRNDRIYQIQKSASDVGVFAME